jgi:hypothetical protein
MSQRTELLSEIEKLEQVTTISMAVREPKQYKANNKKIEALRRKFMKLCSL